jgi:hypothetical protein
VILFRSSLLERILISNLGGYPVNAALNHDSKSMIKKVNIFPKKVNIPLDLDFELETLRMNLAFTCNKN